MRKVLLSSIIALALVSTASAGYSEVSCSTDSVFTENSCTQCFDGGVKAKWANLSLLTDIWSNDTSKVMYMLKWENSLSDSVRMLSLNGAAWSYEPTKGNFWEYTEGLEKLSHDEGFYTLNAWKSVDWIQSKFWYSIKLNKSPTKGQNSWLLKYTLNVHVDDNGTPAEATVSHSECVLFKSAAASVTPEKTPKKGTSKKETPKKLPQTWPQEVLLLLLALLLASILFFVSKRKV